MANFTSSLYLGMRHGSDTLPRWQALTTGRPAALGQPPGADEVAAEVARLVGAEGATLARSTLHALGDCLEVLAGPGSALVVDAGLYAVGQWAVQRAAGAGVPVVRVPHHDVSATTAAVRALGERHLSAVVVADGLCPGCGRSYPLRAVTALVDAHGGTLVIDDTQALGVFGARPDHTRPYGRGGGGSIRHAGTAHDSVIAVSSLAKAFGTPVSCVAGAADVIARIRRTGSALHSSPPSAADIAAAGRAVVCNALAGEALRDRLIQRVRTLRRRAGGQGLVLVGGAFPVQSTPPVNADAGRWLLTQLAHGGVRAVLRRTCAGRGTAVTLVVTAAHRLAEIDTAGALLGAAWREIDEEADHAR